MRSAFERFLGPVYSLNHRAAGLTSSRPTKFSAASKAHPLSGIHFFGSASLRHSRRFIRLTGCGHLDSNGARKYPCVFEKQGLLRTTPCVLLKKMSIQLNMHFQSGLLNVDASGEFSLEEAKRTFLEILDAIARHQAEKVLINGRTMAGKPKNFQRFLYGEFAAQETMRLVRERGISPRFAYVMHAPLRDPRRFGENVAVNRGMKVQTFENPEDAFEWLTNAS